MAGDWDFINQSKDNKLMNLTDQIFLNVFYLNNTF